MIRGKERRVRGDFRLTPRLRSFARRGGAAVGRRIFPEAAAAGDQWQRVVMNGAIDRHIEALGPSALSAVEISGQAHEGRSWKDFRSLNYPEFDLCDPAPQDRTFDVVICEQVLEHVVDPNRAVATLRQLCTSGGHVIVSTPFLIKVHELPLYGMHDYWRFTPRGLRVLLEGAGLTVDTVETWGNRLCVLANLDRWSAYRRWFPLRNEPDVALHVWAFARNPA